MGDRIVITGAAGMIGAVVARRLEAEGHELILIDRRRGERALPESRFIECDLRDRDRVAKEVAGANIVIHIGEIPNIGIGGMSDAEVFATNIEGCRSILDAAVAAGARRFIYTSSCQHYGYWGDMNFDRTRTPARWPIDEFQPAAPRNAYAYSKAFNELACRETSARTGMETFIFRLPFVVPPRSIEDLRAMWRKSDDRPMDGFWTYLTLDDTAEAYALTVRPDRPLEPMPSRCEAFHFVADDVRGIRSAREKLAKELPAYDPLPADWPERSPPVTCVKAARYLGWRPKVRLADVLAKG